MAVAVVAAALGGSARAQTQAWTRSLTGPAPAAPTTDLSFNPTNPSVFVGQGTSIYAFNASSSGAGAQRWTKSLSPATLANFPSPVPTKSGKSVLFFTTTDGMLYAYDVTTPPASGQTPPLLWSKSLRRSTCTSDSVTATPAVQLYNYSSSAFKSAIGDDLVMVPTHYACSTTSANVVYAFKATDGTQAWAFNSCATYPLDFATEGCAVDYTNNRIYCGFNQPSGYAQNTLYALSSTSGARVWAVNVGSVRTQPTLRNNKVYAATYNGYLHARNAATGAAVWSYQVSSTYPITRNPLIETRTNSPYPNAILVVDSSGVIYHVDDTRPLPLVWKNTSLGATSMVVSAPFSHRLYVGKSDGSLHELKFGSGESTGGALVGSSAGTVYDPSIANETGANGQDGDRVFAVSAGALALFDIPWLPYTCDAQTGYCDGANGNMDVILCTQTACQQRYGDCYTAGPCADNECTYTASTCGSPNTCCYASSTLSCRNLNTDVDNCGTCGVACPAGTGCQGGACKSCSVTCGASTPRCTTALNQCVCTNSMGVDTCTQALGSQYTCNTSTGKCTCTPSCPSNVCVSGVSDGCGGTCTPVTCRSAVPTCCTACSPPRCTATAYCDSGCQ